MARILIVEDEAVISMMLEVWLSDLGHKSVGPAATVATALSLIEKGGVDAAIIDLSLDGNLSYEIAEALRGRGMPFAWGTGYNARDIDPAYRNAPILAKPYALDEFEAVLAGLLANPASQVS